MKKIKCNENYFENVDDEYKAYFLGFILADGHIMSDRNKLIISIHKKDIEFLEQFKEKIEFEGDIKTHKYRKNMCGIYISSKKLVKDLEKYNVVKNKTSILEYPQNIPTKLERHFIRGFFDGDGCININTDKRDNKSRGVCTIVCGSMSFLNSLNERMSKIFNINMNKPFGPKNKNYKFIGWASLDNIEKIYINFYENSNIYLSRKKHIFDKVYEFSTKKIKYRKVTYK